MLITNKQRQAGISDWLKGFIGNQRINQWTDPTDGVCYFWTSPDPL